MKDIEIIELFFERNESAIDEAQKKYGKLCRHISYNILGDEGEAEECTNDTYLGVWNSVPPKRPDNLKAYIAKIARNLSLKRLEYNSAKKRASHMTVSLSELDEVLGDEHFYEIGDEPLGELINIFLRGESEDARRVFIRRYYFYDDIKTIAKSFYFSESKVKSLLMRSRNDLKKFLLEKGVYI